MLEVTVCGDTPVAHSIAGIAASRGFHVTVLTRRPRQWQRALTIELPGGDILTGALRGATSDPRAALRGADLVIICSPLFTRCRLLLEIAPHLPKNSLLGAVPGFGGFGLAARNTVPRGMTIFGTQRIPYVVRSTTLGRGVEIAGVRRQTFVGSSPARHAAAVAELLSQVLMVPTVPVSHYLNIELSPSNSIVNPARLYALFGPRARLSRAPQEIEFFLDWNESATRNLLRLDTELQRARSLVPRDLSFVAPIRLQYDANDAREITRRFRNLHTLAPRKIPVTRLDRRWCIDATSSYVTEDLDHGLPVLRGILQLAGASTPFMDELIRWRYGMGAKIRRCHELRLLQGYESIDSLATALD